MIFLVGWFRSGTSMLWNIFRSTGRYHCYYEPFHEYLPQLAYSGCRRDTDPTHHAIDNYWAEYDIIPKEKLIRLWKPWYSESRWRILPTEQAEDLKEYLVFLSQHALKKPFFKLVRANFRVQWLRHTFPDAKIILVNRDPRKIWDSMQKRDSVSSSAENSKTEITQQGFSNYILQMALEMGFPIRDNLYGTFYEMWHSSYREAIDHVDAVWWYEDIVSDYESWAKENLVNTGITDTIPPYNIKPITKYYNDNISEYLGAELGHAPATTPSSTPVTQRILDEIPARNREIVLLRSRILELESELCREREKQHLASANLILHLKEKTKKNWFKARKYFIKP